MIKPDGVLRGLVGEIIKRVESKGLKIVGMKLLWLNSDTAGKHYDEHEGKPYFELLVNYVSSAPAVAMVLEGRKAIEVVRRMVGSTDPVDAEPGTIRGDFGLERRIVMFNLVHASDSPTSAEKEISMFFDAGEIHPYDLPSESIYQI
jgi:nucleoside-diphosphate kinase